MHACIHTCCMHACMHLCIYAFMYARTHICLPATMHVCIYCQCLRTPLRDFGLVSKKVFCCICRGRRRAFFHGQSIAFFNKSWFPCCLNERFRGLGQRHCSHRHPQHVSPYFYNGLGNHSCRNYVKHNLTLGPYAQVDHVEST